MKKKTFLGSSCSHLPWNRKFDYQSSGRFRIMCFVISLGSIASYLKHRGHRILVCENQPGSYQCPCPAGYHGNGREDGSGCEDDDECLKNPCQENAACQNTLGKIEKKSLRKDNISWTVYFSRFAFIIKIGRRVNTAPLSRQGPPKIWAEVNKNYFKWFQ